MWHLVSVVYQWLHQHVSPEGWSALGTWAIVLVAVIAAVIALLQVRQIRITRQRQTQPNVVAFARLNAKGWQFLDLVVANYGLTPAYHIKLKFEPLTVAPRDPGGHATELYLPDEIAVLAPGQEWRTMWDSAIPREDKRDELGSRFEGSVEFQDHDGNKFENRAILDWNTFRNTIELGDTPSESAKAIAEQLSQIGRILKSYQAEHDGIWTYPVPADEQRSYTQQRAAEAKAARDRTMRDLQGRQERPPIAPETSPEANETG